MRTIPKWILAIVTILLLMSGCVPNGQSVKEANRYKFNYSEGDAFEVAVPMFMFQTSYNSCYIESCREFGLSPDAYFDESLRKKYRIIKLLKHGDIIKLKKRTFRSISGVSEEWQIVGTDLNASARFFHFGTKYDADGAIYCEYDNKQIRKAK